MESFAEWFGLGRDAPDLYARYWDWNLQMLRSLVDPWPAGWPDSLHDLNAAAVEAGVEIPPMQANHLAPRPRRLEQRPVRADHSVPAKLSGVAALQNPLR